MGPCEQQSCEESSFILARARGSDALGAALIQAPIPVASAALQSFHDARDDFASLSFVVNAVPRTLILRI
jgi:hypothetical protein